MKLIIVFLFLLIVSMIMAADKQTVKLNNTPVNSYPKRVLLCMFSLILAIGIMFWLVLLPILGLILLLL